MNCYYQTKRLFYYNHSTDTFTSERAAIGGPRLSLNVCRLSYYDDTFNYLTIHAGEMNIALTPANHCYLLPRIVRFILRTVGNHVWHIAQKGDQ